MRHIVTNHKIRDIEEVNDMAQMIDWSATQKAVDAMNAKKEHVDRLNDMRDKRDMAEARLYKASERLGRAIISEKQAKAALAKIDETIEDLKAGIEVQS